MSYDRGIWPGCTLKVQSGRRDHNHRPGLYRSHGYLLRTTAQRSQKREKDHCVSQRGHPIIGSMVIRLLHLASTVASTVASTMQSCR